MKGSVGPLRFRHSPRIGPGSLAAGAPDAFLVGTVVVPKISPALPRVGQQCRELHMELQRRGGEEGRTTQRKGRKKGVWAGNQTSNNNNGQKTISRKPPYDNEANLRLRLQLLLLLPLPVEVAPAAGRADEARRTAYECRRVAAASLVGPWAGGRAGEGSRSRRCAFCGLPGGSGYRGCGAESGGALRSALGWERLRGRWLGRSLGGSWLPRGWGGRGQNACAASAQVRTAG